MHVLLAVIVYLFLIDAAFNEGRVCVAIFRWVFYAILFGIIMLALFR